MAGRYLDTPRTEYDDQTRMMTTADEVDFSMEPSFQAPPGHDNILAQARGGKSQTLRTPSARSNLVSQRAKPGKAEFTPLLKSATANRAKQMNGRGVGALNFGRGPTTPAALKPGYVDNDSPLPEASVYDAVNSSSISEFRANDTSIPPAVSSSILSTPMPIQRKDGEGPLDGGNVLSLREQEEVSLIQKTLMHRLSQTDNGVETRQNSKREFRPETQDPFPRREPTKARPRIQRDRTSRKHWPENRENSDD